MIKRPMKAMSKSLTDKDAKLLNYPVVASPKLDGIRGMVINEVVLSSTLKPIGNKYIQECLGKEYNNLEGELIVGDPCDPDSFNNTTGAVRRSSGEPDFKFYIFDNFKEPSLSYKERFLNESLRFAVLPHIVVVEQTPIHNFEELELYEKMVLNKGYEGAMVRSFDGVYKEGRTTLREQNIFKRKPVSDAEALVVGFNEQMKNNNEKTLNELGKNVRSSHKENKTPAGTLGSFILKCDLWDEPFHCGSGMTDGLKQDIWDHKDEYMGLTVVFKYQAYGSREAPRQPIFKGFRDQDDMVEY
jgi:DNA ligase-1